MDTDSRFFQQARLEMVRDQIMARGVRDLRVLNAMQTIARHRFVPAGAWNRAYGDYPLQIGPEQTISQPFIVAYMAEALALSSVDRVLEVGSGCGYACAVLSMLCGEVFGVELDEVLAYRSRELLASLGIGNVEVQCGDGYFGWEEHAPYDAIMLSCCVPEVPAALWGQLKEGGRILAPVGATDFVQQLCLSTKVSNERRMQRLLHVSFVPMRSRESLNRSGNGAKAGGE
jgi:protein-L-isoaspartate(D-aspartate) O-methyltransferase